MDMYNLQTIKHPPQPVSSVFFLRVLLPALLAPLTSPYSLRRMKVVFFPDLARNEKNKN